MNMLDWIVVAGLLSVAGITGSVLGAMFCALKPLPSGLPQEAARLFGLKFVQKDFACYSAYSVAPSMEPYISAGAVSKEDRAKLPRMYEGYRVRVRIGTPQFASRLWRSIRR
jgi:hypothetical protein